MKLPVHIRSSHATSAYQAYCPDLPGCSASGPTEDEALRLLRRRVDDYFANSGWRAPTGTRVLTLDV